MGQRSAASAPAVPRNAPSASLASARRRRSFYAGLFGAVLLAALGVIVVRPDKQRLVYTSDLVIHLERTTCFLDCPAYSLVIFGDGRVAYNGKSNVLAIGEHAGTISVDAVKALVAAFNDAGYMELQDRYVSEHMNDFPTVTTAISTGDRHKAVFHFHGSEDAPPALSALERQIDAAVDVTQWTGH